MNHKNKQQALRSLPSMDQLLDQEIMVSLAQELGRERVLSVAREVMESIRREILENNQEDGHIGLEGIVTRIESFLAQGKKYRLHKVSNGTGVILHTNLGRARLSKEACENVTQVSQGYSTLEYDTQAGKRGSRHDHLEKLLQKITGAEAAMMVNNNAAATLLCLSAMGKEKEILVSRGELVEIGGSFRIPDIMQLGGAYLREVGTTNKTTLGDYAGGITEETAMLLKVHTSNYQIVGFTEETTLEELVALGKEEHIPVVYDMGSGLMTHLAEHHIEEPDVKKSLATGIDVILFSGDKLLGGPQGGIIAGKKKYIDQMKAHPLARAVRVDKMTLAAMEATLMAYENQEEAKKTIPVLNMITTEKETLEKRARSLAEKIRCRLGENTGYRVGVSPSTSKIGGGTTPLEEMESYALTLEHNRWTCDEIEEELRSQKVPVIGRKFQNKVYLDMRTILEEDLSFVIEAVLSCSGNKGK